MRTRVGEMQENPNFSRQSGNPKFRLFNGIFMETIQAENSGDYDTISS